MSNLKQPYTIQSQETNSLFFVDYYITMPLFVLGSLMNGYALAVAWRWRDHIIVERIHTIMMGMVGACFLMTLSSVIQYSIWLHLANDAFYRAEALFASIALDCLLSLNLSLAIERFSIVRCVQESVRRRLHLAVAVFASVAGFVVIITFATSPSEDIVSPSHDPQAIIWEVTVGIFLTVVFSSIIVLYTSTYMYAVSALKKMTTAGLLTSGLEAVQRRVLFRSITMFVTLAFGYLPQVVTLAAKNVFEFKDEYGVANAIAWTAIALDGCLTPLLVVYFIPELRARLFVWRN
ncbi:hypothetical protein BDR26DRAFT_858695, partial [Obelidium mucronatum]